MLRGHCSKETISEYQCEVSSVATHTFIYEMPRERPGAMMGFHQSSVSRPGLFKIVKPFLPRSVLCSMQGTDMACDLCPLAFLGWKRVSRRFPLPLLCPVSFFSVFVSIIVFDVSGSLFLTQSPALSLSLFYERWVAFAFGYSDRKEKER